jgi:predicted O-methyltransferase YrrM
MTHDEAGTYISSLYMNLFNRTPASNEYDYWVKFMLEGNSAEKAYYRFVDSAEYKLKTKVAVAFFAGHYYSPIVDPATVTDYIARERSEEANVLPGISLPIDEMAEFWQKSAAVIAATPFQETKNEKQRYYYDNNIFPYGDAIGLRAMIADLRPRAMIEIGSGFSSACMLDCADEFGLDTRFTFIDPYPERLKGLLRQSDHRRVTIIEEPVQKTDQNLYKSLNRGDVLFIDSTHVLKTGSDVHYELFHILPCLQQGVVIHFHDIQFPFEYPDPWIFNTNYSWNEIYALRAFLMYNTNFKIRFWGDCLARTRTNMVRNVYPLFLKNPGGSLWIEKV